MDAMKKKLFLSLAVLGAMCVCVAPVEAVIIPLEDSGWAMVVSPSVWESGQVGEPYVYGVVDDAVVLQLDKLFNRPAQGGFVDPIIIEFQKISTNAALNIIIRDEYIINDTGVEWVDYHMHLISCQTGFNPNFLPDGHQFEEVFYGDNYGYNDLPTRLHFVNTEGGGVPYSPPGDDVFQPGYAGGQIVIVTDPEMEVGARFGLKEVPTIPEPAALLLLGIGGLMALNRKTAHALSGFGTKPISVSKA